MIHCKKYYCALLLLSKFSDQGNISKREKNQKYCIDYSSCHFFVGKEYPGFSSGEFGKDKSNYRKYGEQIVVTSILQCLKVNNVVPAQRLGGYILAGVDLLLLTERWTYNWVSL